MKKLALSALLVVMLCGSALAHNGAVSLYIMDETVMICNKDIGTGESAVISVYYVKDLGYELGYGVEFKLLSSLPSPSTIFIQATWIPEFVLTLGDVDNGISLTGQACLGTGQDVFYIGDVEVYLNDAPSTFTVRVVEHPGVLPPAINMVRCDEAHSMVQVLGGTFVFNGSCNPAVQPKTWSSIKELYR